MVAGTVDLMESFGSTYHESARNAITTGGLSECGTELTLSHAPGQHHTSRTCGLQVDKGLKDIEERSDG